MNKGANMEGFKFDTHSYLRRLRLFDAVNPDMKGLKALQRAQLFNIPLENFDIQLGREIKLDPAPLFEKLVRRPRGGYCFELNGLLLMALHAFGFEARPLLGRVHLTGVPSGRGHQISLVDLGGRKWIVDVGFGKDTPLEPLLLKLGMVQECNGRSFRLVEGGGFGTMLQYLDGIDWQNLYSFDMEHVCKADIFYGNYYTSTNPNSFFTSSRIAVQQLDEGMNVLFNNRLKLVRSGREEMIELPEGQRYLDALKTFFGIELDASYEALKPVSQG